MMNKKILVLILLGMLPVHPNLCCCLEPDGSDSDADFPPTQPLDGIVRASHKIAGYRAETEAHRTGHYAVCSCQGSRPSMEDAHCAEAYLAGQPITAFFG